MAARVGVDYKGVAIGGGWIVLGVFAGLVAPMVHEILIHPNSRAVGDGIGMLMWAALTVPMGLFSGLAMAARSWKKRHPAKSRDIPPNTVG